jgi:hypothetical protein
MMQHNEAGKLMATGQTVCYDTEGAVIDCPDTGQDGEFQRGTRWEDRLRFQLQDQQVKDTLTGLVWPVDANIAGFPVSWNEALVLDIDQFCRCV